MRKTLIVCALTLALAACDKGNAPAAGAAADAATPVASAADIAAESKRLNEWFEKKYPGWYAEFGEFWKWYAKLSKPGQKVITFNEEVGYVYPHRCWSCLVPCLIREDIVTDTIDGQVHTFAHELDRWTAVEAFSSEYQGRPTPAMGRFSGKREWETLYHGWDLADAIKDLNFVRKCNESLSMMKLRSFTLALDCQYQPIHQIDGDCCKHFT